ncbi:MAG: hypothetical protein REJ23_04730, partial [Brevundimonas sp.]|nr:hypothetical protein [Brevundimonas sp.]
GSTFVLSMELLMYGNGSTRVLTYPVAAAAQLAEEAKGSIGGDTGPQVLPGLSDDLGGATAKAALDQPVVLPGLADDVTAKTAEAGPQVRPDVADAGAKAAPVDLPLVLPGLPDDGFVDYKGVLAEPLVRPDVFNDDLSGPGGGQGGGGLTGPGFDLFPTDLPGHEHHDNFDLLHRSQIGKATDHDVWN